MASSSLPSTPPSFSSSSSSSRPTPEGVLAYVAHLQLQLHDDMVRMRKERMERQEAALRAYVDTLPSGAEFPFVRYTSDTGRRTSGFHLDASGIAPYLGVVAHRAAASRDSFVLPYPGVVMTRSEYDRMPIAAPTACDTHLGDLVREGRYRGARFVLVGLPTALGPNIMSNNNSSFVANVQLVEDEHAVQHVANTLQQTLVRDDYVFVRRTAARSSIAPGDELFTGLYSADFFTTSRTSCDVCFLVDAKRNLMRCADCCIRVHARCRDRLQVEAEEGERGLPHRCSYHQRIAQIEHERDIFAADVPAPPAVVSIRQFVQQKRATSGRKVRRTFPFEGVFWVCMHDLPAPFRTLRGLFEAIRADEQLRPMAVSVVAMHEDGDYTLLFAEHADPAHYGASLPAHAPDARLEWLWDSEQAARFLDECDRKADAKREQRRQRSSSGGSKS